MPHPLHRPTTAALVVFLAACGTASGRDSRRAADSSGGVGTIAAATIAATGATGAAPADTGVPTPIAATLAPHIGGRVRPPALSAAAQAVADRMVFAPRPQSWFVVAARGRRMLVDLGRVDLAVDAKKDSSVRAAFREAAARLSPVPAGSWLRLRGPWGVEDDSVAGFDSWNGRIVATLVVSHALDSLARHRETLVGSALRISRDSLLRADSLATAALGATMSATASAPASAPATMAATMATTGAVPADSAAPLPCVRDSVTPELLARAVVVRDSIQQLLLEKEQPPYESQRASVKVSATQAAGCYGVLGRLALVVSLRAAGNAWVRERLVVLDTAGTPTPLRVSDYRFKAHDALYAFDADGDGVDDLAARGYAERMGGTVVLRLDGKAKRAERIAGGFAWETQ